MARDLEDGPAKAVQRLVSGLMTDDATQRQFERTAAFVGVSAVDSGSPERLKAWWIYRCLYSPRPLVERLTLMWHNHFATSNRKINDLRLIKRQNEAFREHALAPFGPLISEMLRDPALLAWLDASSNRKGKPNENLARELFELFSLGIGNYTETDIREAARALTGRSVRRGEFYDRAAVHDEGDKTVLGKTGPWNGDDLVRILLDHPATAKRIAWRLTNEFFSEGVVDEGGLEELANGLREHHLDIAWGVSTILQSRLFFSDANIGTRICDPVTFLLLPLRALELTHDSPSTVVLAEWLTRFGLDLFYPANVGGWPGGRSWLSTRTVIARTNYVAALAEGRLSAVSCPPDLTALFSPGDSPTSDNVVEELAERLFGDGGSPALAQIKASVGQAENLQTDSRKAIVALLTSTLAQAH